MGEESATFILDIFVHVFLIDLRFTKRIVAASRPLFWLNARAHGHTSFH